MNILDFTINDWVWEILKQEENQMKRHDFRIVKNGECGWYIAVVNSVGRDYLHKDLKIHRGTGYIESGELKYGKASGYFPSRKIAEIYLRLYLKNLKREKQKMANKIEINVKVNGKDVALHEISEQTLLTVRENSKSKKIPIARVANFNNGNSDDTGRLLLKVPRNIGDYIGKIVAISLTNGEICNYWELNIDDNYSKEYQNIIVIS